MTPTGISLPHAMKAAPKQRGPKAIEMHPTIDFSIYSTKYGLQSRASHAAFYHQQQTHRAPAEDLDRCLTAR
jgi:hypothetical protein